MRYGIITNDADSICMAVEYTYVAGRARVLHSARQSASVNVNGDGDGDGDGDAACGQDDLVIGERAAQVEDVDMDQKDVVTGGEAGSGRRGHYAIKRLEFTL